uniref:Uncharacterized protein n=1 Tax=Tanacetum cinerariifolium TaxID=118510 RepID=A0A6L2MKC9_TANCI|nr:hypothetical protein [Tanacetum cinerariifolium]
MATKPKVDVDLSGNPVDQTDYRSKIGSLMYLTSSRPDIVQAGSSFELTAFSDADHDGCIDSRKSTSGGIQFLDENPSRANIQQALGRKSYALSWKPCQGDSLNPPDHRYSAYTIKRETGELEAFKDPDEVYDTLMCLRDDRRAEETKLADLNDLITQKEEDIEAKNTHVEMMENERNDDAIVFQEAVGQDVARRRKRLGAGESRPAGQRRLGQRRVGQRRVGLVPLKDNQMTSLIMQLSMTIPMKRPLKTPLRT